MIASISAQPRGLVIAIDFPFRSFTELIGELGIVTSTKSAAVCVIVFIIRTSAPFRIASTAALSETMAYPILSPAASSDQSQFPAARRDDPGNIYASLLVVPEFESHTQLSRIERAPPLGRDDLISGGDASSCARKHACDANGK